MEQDDRDTAQDEHIHFIRTCFVGAVVATRMVEQLYKCCIDSLLSAYCGGAILVHHNSNGGRGPCCICCGLMHTRPVVLFSLGFCMLCPARVAAPGLHIVVNNSRRLSCTLQQHGHGNSAVLAGQWTRPTDASFIICAALLDSQLAGLVLRIVHVAFLPKPGWVT